MFIRISLLARLSWLMLLCPTLVCADDDARDNSARVQRWLAEYGGTWGQVHMRGDLPSWAAVYNSYLLISEGAPGRLRIQGVLHGGSTKDAQGHSVDNCSFEADGLELPEQGMYWEWRNRNNEQCSLRLEGNGQAVRAYFSGCAYECTDSARIQGLELEHFSAKKMQAPSDMVLGLCISDNLRRREVCLSPNLRVVIGEYVKLRESAYNVMPDASLPADASDLALKLAKSCADVSCIERGFSDQLEKLRRSLQRRLGALASGEPWVAMNSTLFRGTLGREKVVACLRIAESGEISGLYYLESTGKDWTLERPAPDAEVPAPQLMDRGFIPRANDGGDEWQDARGIWQLSAIGPERIRGTRHSLRRETSSAIDLRRTLSFRNTRVGGLAMFASPSITVPQALPPPRSTLFCVNILPMPMPVGLGVRKLPCQ